jgi:HEAT repeat protein
MVSEPTEALGALLARLRAEPTIGGKRTILGLIRSLSSNSVTLVQELIPYLGHDPLRYEAREILASCGQSAVGPLNEVLAKGDALSRTFACYVLSDIGPNSAPTILHLLECFITGGEFLHYAAGKALLSIGSQAVPAFVQALHDIGLAGDRNREDAAVALAEAAPGDQAAITSLARALDDPIGDVRFAAANALLAISEKHIGRVSVKYVDKAKEVIVAARAP